VVTSGAIDLLHPGHCQKSYSPSHVYDGRHMTRTYGIKPVYL